MLGRRTKLKIFQACVISVLLHDCTMWKMTYERMLDVFAHTCLRRILRSFWPIRFSNEDIRRRAGMREVSELARIRRWKFIGHILTSDGVDHRKIAMRWTPVAGKKRRGRPRETWRTTS